MKKTACLLLSILALSALMVDKPERQLQPPMSQYEQYIHNRLDPLTDKMRTDTATAAEAREHRELVNELQRHIKESR